MTASSRRCSPTPRSSPRSPTSSASYGEDAVEKMTNGLSRRIHHGEFTLRRIPQ